MKIAIPYDKGKVGQHFGSTEVFRFYETHNGVIRIGEAVPVSGTGHGVMCAVLQENGADALICGGIGGGAIEAIESCGIRVYAGVTGNADEAVAALLQERLIYDTESAREHHGHHKE